MHGTKTYSDRGDVMLLFVRERTHINLWRWVQAKLDPDIDLLKQGDVTGGTSQKFANEQDVCDMSQSQVAARVAALQALGYHVPVLPGLDIVGHVRPGRTEAVPRVTRQGVATLRRDRLGRRSRS